MASYLFRVTYVGFLACAVTIGFQSLAHAMSLTPTSDYYYSADFFGQKGSSDLKTVRPVGSFLSSSFENWNYTDGLGKETGDFKTSNLKDGPFSGGDFDYRFRYGQIRWREADYWFLKDIVLKDWGVIAWIWIMCEDDFHSCDPHKHSKGDGPPEGGGPKAPKDPPATPLPAALPLFATGLGVFGFASLWRKRRATKANLAVLAFRVT